MKNMKLSYKINAILILTLLSFSIFFLLFIHAYESNRKKQNLNRLINYHINQIRQDSQVVISNLLLEQQIAVDIYFDRILKKNKNIAAVFLLNDDFKRSSLEKKNDTVFIERDQNKLVSVHGYKYS